MTKTTNPAAGNRGAFEADLPGGTIASTNKAPNSTNQLPVPYAPSLHDLAANVRASHASVLAAFSTAANHAVEAGLSLATAKRCTDHGRWTDFVRSCDLTPRTAARYMQLADLAGQIGRATTDLNGLSIERAIKHLSPPKPAKSATEPKPPASANRKTKTSTSGRAGHAADIVSAWIAAAPTERVNAIDSIGLEAVLAAIPTEWLALLEARLAFRRQSPAPLPAIDDDLSIPTFLRRQALAEADAV
jgi:hypothetical protein